MAGATGETPAAAPAPKKRGKGLWIVIIVVVVVVVILLAAVFGGLLGVPEEQVLKVGTVLSITGGLAAFGPGNRDAVIMAAEEINAAGGVLGRPIQLFHQNDDTKPETARTAATTVISQNRVDAIIGATGSGQCAVVVEIAKANNVFEISGSCTSTVMANLTLTGGWWARTAPPDLYQGVVAASYARTNRSFTNSAIIGINNAYGVALSNVYKDGFVAFGGTITAGSPRIITEVQSGATDYTADLIAALEPSTGPAPEIVYIVAYPPDGIQLMKNFEAGKPTHPSWSNVVLLFSEGVFEQKAFLDVLRNPPNNFNISAYQGTAPAAFGGVVGQNYATWAAKYRDRWGRNTTLFDDGNYDAMYLVALAAQRGGKATGQAIKDNINAVANPPGTKVFAGEWSKAVAEIAAGRDIDYEGASGAVNIDNLGDSLTGYIVWAVNATTGQAYNLEVFPESLVTSLVDQANPAPAMPTRSMGVDWEPAAPTRETEGQPPR